MYTYLCMIPLIYLSLLIWICFWFFVYIDIYLDMYCYVVFVFWNYCHVNFIISSFSVLCSLYIHMYGSLNINFISYSFTCTLFMCFEQFWCKHFCVSTFSRRFVFLREHVLQEICQVGVQRLPLALQGGLKSSIQAL